MFLFNPESLDNYIKNLGFHGICIKADKYQSGKDTYYDVYDYKTGESIILKDYSFETVKEFLVSTCTKLDLALFEKQSKLMQDVVLVYGDL